MIQFKIRCSSIIHIMGRSGLTEKQQEDLILLQSKPTRTAKQDATLQDLITKRDNEDIPEGCKTHLRNWSKSKLYNRRKEIGSKYLEKGTQVEDQAIEMLADFLGKGFLFKNEQLFEDDHLRGIPDVLPKTEVFEIKCPWDWSTFPAFEHEVPKYEYWLQCQGYMGLTGLDNAKLCYVLCDTPHDLIQQAAKRKSWDLGLGGEVTEELYEEFEQAMTYSDIPLEQRVKVFDIARDEKAIQQIRDRVIQCRKFLGNLEF